MRTVSVLVLFSAFAQLASAEERWKEFSSREGKFKVLLPGEPKLLKSTQKAGDGSDVQITTYRIPVVDGKTILLATSDFSEAYLKTPPEKILDAARDAGANRSGGKLMREKKITLGKNPGREFVIQLPKEGGYLRARAILVGPRQYSLLFHAKDESTITSKEADAFFNSFKLIP